MFRILILILAIQCFGTELSQWEGFDYQEMGLTQIEFQRARESGMTKKQLLELLEIGISPAEYLRKPWKKLNVSEKLWILERSRGMHDGDIDQTYNVADHQRRDAKLSLLVPGLYQWKYKRYPQAALISTWTLSTWGCAGWFLYHNDPDAKWLMLASLGAHIFSFLDGMSQNPARMERRIRHLSWGPVPQKDGGALVLSYSF